MRQFNGSGSQRNWLLSILKHKIVDQVRVRERQTANSTTQNFDPTSLLFDENGQWRGGVIPSIGPDTQLELSEIWDVVRQCLTALPQAQADVFVLSVMEQMESGRICDELRISPNNLQVRLHRARLGLAKCVSSKWFLVNEEAGEHE